MNDESAERLRRAAEDAGRARIVGRRQTARARPPVKINRWRNIPHGVGDRCGGWLNVTAGTEVPALSRSNGFTTSGAQFTQSSWKLCSKAYAWRHVSFAKNCPLVGPRQCRSVPGWVGRAGVDIRQRTTDDREPPTAEFVVMSRTGRASAGWPAAYVSSTGWLVKAAVCPCTPRHAGSARLPVW